MAAVVVSPLQQADLPAAGQFLTDHLNAKIAPQAWVASLTHPWCETRPNYGFQAHDGDKLVGVFCAIYSDQVIGGRPERFCNPHSWCMLEDYRSQSVKLPLHLIRQRGYHFTMLTPNPKVAEIFVHLGFRTLDDRVIVFPNRPSAAALFGRHVAPTDKDAIAGVLEGSARRDFDAHRDIPWLRFVAFGAPGDMCLVVYKRSRWKKLPCARILAISDAAAFERHGRLFQHRMLVGEGLAVSRVEQRFVAQPPPLSRTETRTQAKLCMSASLGDAQIRDLYSELVALDL